ncbi:CCA tRNA nucleotidyltransferase [Bacillus niameyensis]|uniref:CCA tRNA nucleotidyltransferase n=1 Tax=Bacillus niameyensis TaxID=1522308 RepID=UPI000785C48E|nr:CCA tRNA nucleotidyltransferase [Bacillus niameyensis]
MNPIFLSALPIIRKIEEAGFEAYFVGGAVRDFLLGREIHDIDIATSATPKELKAIFSTTVDVGIEHGTILVIENGQGYEVTTFRSESDYIDFRRPETVTFIRSLREDLQRRDFTINAIAMNADGEIIDPFQGQEAIANKVIETVGNPADRFMEDGLRLMRAIRFVSQLGFRLDNNTERELAHHASILAHIAVERVSAEMTKLLDGNFKEQALIMTLNTKLYNFMPGIFNQAEVILSCVKLSIEKLNEFEMWVLGLYFSRPSNPTSELRKWKLPAKKIKSIVRSYELLDWRIKNQWTAFQLYRAGIETADLVEKVYRVIEKNEQLTTNIHEQYNKIPITSRSQLAVSGKDLLEWTNKPAGPWMKELFDNLEKAVINQDIPNERNAIRRWVEIVKDY